jgi:hypothetical protein
MAISDKISLETRFQLNNSPENFRIQDTTDYASEGIATSDVIGALVIIDPNGNTVHSTTLPAFDIDVDAQDYIDSINLPKDSDGNVLSGNYTITYTIRVAGAVQPGDYDETFVYEYCYVRPTVEINIEVDVICSTFTSTDITGYPAEITTETRTHTIVPPAGLPDATYPDQVVSTVSNIYSGITTKTWTALISNVIEITYTDGLIVDDTITGDKEKVITDDINLCNLQCAMRALVTRYNDAASNNPIDADKIYRENLSGALVNAYMYTSNIQCGNYAKAETYYQEVLVYTESEPDCACSDSETPTPIVPSCIGGGGGGSITYVVDACGTNNAITVTPTTLGDTTTYTVCFNQALFDKLGVLTETNIVSTDGSVGITPSTNGYNKEYDLSVTPTAVDSFIGLFDITMAASPSNPPASEAFRANWSTTIGTKLQEPNITNVNSGAWGTNNNSFYFDGYIAASGGEYPKPQFQVIGQDPSTSFNGKTIEVVISQIDTTNDRIYFEFVDNYGNPFAGVNLSQLVGADQVLTISVLINA